MARTKYTVEKDLNKRLNLELSQLKYRLNPDRDCVSTQTPDVWEWEDEYLEAGEKMDAVERHIGARKRVLGKLEGQVHEARVKAMMMERHSGDKSVQVDLTAEVFTSLRREHSLTQRGVIQRVSASIQLICVGAELATQVANVEDLSKLKDALQFQLSSYQEMLSSSSRHKTGKAGNRSRQNLVERAVGPDTSGMDELEKAYEIIDALQLLGIDKDCILKSTKKDYHTVSGQLSRAEEELARLKQESLEQASRERLEASAVEKALKAAEEEAWKARELLKNASGDEAVALMEKLQVAEASAAHAQQRMACIQDGIVSKGYDSLPFGCRQSMIDISLGKIPTLASRVPGAPLTDQPTFVYSRVGGRAPLTDHQHVSVPVRDAEIQTVTNQSSDCVVEAETQTDGDSVVEALEDAYESAKTRICELIEENTQLRTDVKDRKKAENALVRRLRRMEEEHMKQLQQLLRGTREADGEDTTKDTNRRGRTDEDSTEQTRTRTDEDTTVLGGSNEQTAMKTKVGHACVNSCRCWHS